MALICDIFVPGLLTPRRSADSHHPAENKLVQLEQLIRLCHPRATGRCAEALADILRLPQLPYASWLAAAFDYPVNKQWFIIEPIATRLEHNAIYVTGNQFHDLPHETAHKLCDGLTALERDAGWQFFAVTPHQWLMFQQTLSDVNTVPLCEAVGRDLRDTWPIGNEQSVVHRHMTEWQMWLHGHDANKSLGHPIQALWMWGNGVSMTPSAFPWQQMYCDEAWSRGLAKIRGIDHYPLDRFLGKSLHKNTLIWVNDLLEPFSMGNNRKWQENCDRLFAQVLEPLMKNAFDMFDVVRFYPDDGFCYEKHRSERWKIWRRPKLKIQMDDQANDV